VLELAERERREPVAATLVTWEHGLVDDDDVATAAPQFDRRRGTGRAGTHDEHVARELRCGRGPSGGPGGGPSGGRDG
jgi:hypothetical protein